MAHPSVMKSTKYTSLEVDRELNPFLEQDDSSNYIQPTAEARIALSNKRTAPTTTTNNSEYCSKVTIGVVLVLTVINVAILYINSSRTFSDASSNGSGSTVTGFTAQNIAFGSCTSYDLRQMSIWTDAIIPSSPDVWIWAGDMVYLDDNEVNCAIFETTQEWQQSCNCSQTWLLNPPYTCHAGDAEYANQRWITTLNNEPYNQFLDHMCPKSRSLGMSLLYYICSICLF